MEPSRTCTSCYKFIVVSKFNKNPKTGEYYKGCIKCNQRSAAYQKEYLARNLAKCKELEKKQEQQLKYLGCTFEEYTIYISNQFRDGMNWQNRGTFWDISYIVPMTWGNPSIEEKLQRMYFLNTQPLTLDEIKEKGNNIRPQDANKMEKFYSWKTSPK